MASDVDDMPVHRLRAMRAAGAGSVEMLRFLAAAGLSTPDMMAAFRVAFGLDSYAVAPIGGWFADGTGELDDAAVGALLDPALAATPGE